MARTLRAGDVPLLPQGDVPDVGAPFGELGAGVGGPDEVLEDLVLEAPLLGGGFEEPDGALDARGVVGCALLAEGRSQLVAGDDPGSYFELDGMEQAAVEVPVGMDDRLPRHDG